MQSSRGGKKRSNLRRKAPKSRKDVAILSKPMRRAIKQVIATQAETKRATFYQTANNGSSGAIATGLFSGRGWAVQNNTITNNTTDLLQIIPYLAQGTNDWERIGKTVRTVALNVKGSVRITGSLVNAIGTPGTNLVVYLYFLQHVSLKDYTNLRARNDMTQLLETGEGYNAPFLGNTLDPHQPVANEWYNLLTRRKIVLRYGGAALPGGTLTTPVSVANAHQWYADFDVNLTKHCPKKLVFPEDDVSLPPTVYNSPTNSSIFMCVGFVDESQGSPGSTLVRPWLEQTYVSSYLYKDM